MPALTISSLSPPSVPSTLPTMVTAFGSNYASGAVRMYIDGVDYGPVQFINSGQVRFYSPANVGYSGVKSIELRRTGYDSAFKNLTFNPPPTVTSVSPTSGPTGGGPLEVTGNNFVAGASVPVGGTPASSVTVVNSTTITCVTPGGSAGAKDVRVTNPDGQYDILAGGYTYVAGPTISSVTPASGPTAGGTVCTALGSGYVDGATVEVGGVAATDVTFNNSGAISYTTPAGTLGAKDVVITNPDSQSATSVGAFTYVAAPTITSFSPASGPIGTLVTVTGTNLSSASQKFHNNVAATLNSNTSTQTVAPVPGGTVTGPIVINTAGGSVTSATDFTVTTPVVAPTLDTETHIVFHSHGDTYHSLHLPALPANATGWKLFTAAGVLIASALPGNFDYDRTGLTPNTDYGYKLKASNGAGDSAFSDEEWCRTNEFPGGGINPPSTPDAPAVAKDCEAGTLVVTDSEWEETDSTPIVTSGLRRRVNGGSIEVLAPEDWDAPDGEYTDEDVEAFDSVEYSVNRSNGAGDSEWSAWSTPVLLQSTTTLAVVSPAAGIIAGRKTLRFSASGAITNPRVLWDGTQIGSEDDGTVELRDGYYVFDWKTYLSSQGSGTLRFQATGADGCEAKTERAYTLANGAKEASIYFDVICANNVAPDGQRVRNALLGFQAEPQDANPDLRYRARVAAYLDDLGAGDDFDLGFDEETWAEGQSLLLTRGRVLTDGTAQWSWIDFLAKKVETVGKRLIFRFRLDAEETVLGYSTFGAGSDSLISKFRDDGESDDADYRVLFLARKEDNSAAKIYAFDGTDVNELYDLSDYDAADAFDFALAGDKLFIATPTELFYIDLDSGEASANLTPRGEVRSVAFLESVNGVLYAIFVDAGETPKTKCYRWDGSWKEVWTLADAVTAANVDEGTLYVAAGAKLYSTSGASTPTLKNTFTANITAMGARFVGLADGKVLELVNNAWIQRLDRALGISAITECSGTDEEAHGVAGEASTTLIEQTVVPATWSTSRVLAAPALMDEDVDGVMALHCFRKQISADSGNEGTPEFVAATYREILLIGTSPDGLLLAIENSDVVNDPLAVPASGISAMRARPILEDVPEEA